MAWGCFFGTDVLVDWEEIEEKLRHKIDRFLEIIDGWRGGSVKIFGKNSILLINLTKLSKRNRKLC